MSQDSIEKFRRMLQQDEKHFELAKAYLDHFNQLFPRPEPVEAYLFFYEFKGADGKWLVTCKASTDKKRIYSEVKCMLRETDVRNVSPIITVPSPLRSNT